MGVVYHSNFVIWFEVGRVEFLRDLGFSYSEMESGDGLHIAVVDVHCRYRAPARYDDEILVRTWITKIRGPLIYFKYHILRASDEVLLAEGETIHIVVNRRLERVVLPEKYAALLRAAI